MAEGRDRRLLVEELGTGYQVTTATDGDALEQSFDICLLSREAFAEHADRVGTRREETASVFLPFLLLVEPGRRDGIDSAVWEYVDDVVELPVGTAELQARVENLVERRLTARRLADREAQLQSTVADLRLKEAAIDEAPIGLTIAEAGGRDNPLVYANEEFADLTGYDREGALGRDCRFLQGEETDPETVGQIREAVDEKRPVSVDIVNYRKSGEKFWSKLDIAPVAAEDGTVEHYVGFQYDITSRKVRERRAEVLNRVLSHNLRNKMNIIEVYTDILRQEYDGEPPAAFGKIEAAATDLLTLAETARETDRILSRGASADEVITLDEQFQQLISGFRDRYPDASFSLTLPEESPTVAVGGLIAALEEGIDNAVAHNDEPEPTVELGVSTPREGWVEIEIADDGPGIPDQEIDVLREGERALRHADRMGIWLIYWTVTRAGGTLSVQGDCEGSVLSLSIPTAD
jgi:PAS domain S-box-containing protein